jgi:hypothetical protein
MREPGASRHRSATKPAGTPPFGQRNQERGQPARSRCISACVGLAAGRGETARGCCRHASADSTTSQESQRSTREAALRPANSAARRRTDCGVPCYPQEAKFQRESWTGHSLRVAQHNMKPRLRRRLRWRLDVWIGASLCRLKDVKTRTALASLARSQWSQAFRQSMHDSDVPTCACRPSALSTHGRLCSGGSWRTC